MKFILPLALLALTACSGSGNNQASPTYFLGAKNISSVPDYDQQNKGDMEEAIAYLGHYNSQTSEVSASSVNDKANCQYDETLNDENPEESVLEQNIEGEGCDFTYKGKLTRIFKPIEDLDVNSLQVKSGNEYSGTTQFKIESERVQKKLEGLAVDSFESMNYKMTFTRKGRNTSKQYAFGDTYVSELKGKSISGNEAEVRLGRYTKITKTSEQGTIKYSYQVKVTPTYISAFSPSLEQEEPLAEEGEEQLADSEEENKEEPKADEPTPAELPEQIRRISIKISFVRNREVAGSFPSFDAAEINGERLSEDDIKAYEPLFRDLYYKAAY